MGLHWAFSLLGKSYSLLLVRFRIHPSRPRPFFRVPRSVRLRLARLVRAAVPLLLEGTFDPISLEVCRLMLDSSSPPHPSIRLLDITYKRQINMNRRSVTTPEFCIRGCRGPVPWAEANNIKWRLCKVYQGVGLRGASRPPSAVLCCNSIRTPGPLALLLSLVDAQP